jgi:hypothetical protein
MVATSVLPLVKVRAPLLVLVAVSEKGLLPYVFVMALNSISGTVRQVMLIDVMLELCIVPVLLVTVHT